MTEFTNASDLMTIRGIQNRLLDILLADFEAAIDADTVGDAECDAYNTSMDRINQAADDAADIVFDRLEKLAQ